MYPPYGWHLLIKDEKVSDKFVFDSYHSDFESRLDYEIEEGVKNGEWSYEKYDERPAIWNLKAKFLRTKCFVLNQKMES